MGKYALANPDIRPRATPHQASLKAKLPLEQAYPAFNASPEVLQPFEPRLFLLRKPFLIDFPPDTPILHRLVNEEQDITILERSVGHESAEAKRKLPSHNPDVCLAACARSLGSQGPDGSHMTRMRREMAVFVICVERRVI